MRSLTITSLGLALATSGCARVAGSPEAAPAESGAFVVRLGTDTVAVEAFTRTGNRIEGQLLNRNPRVSVTSYVLTLDAAGVPATIETRTRLADGSLPPGSNVVRSTVVTLTPDSVIAQVQRDTLVNVRAAGRVPFPYINLAPSLLEFPILALRRLNVDSAPFSRYPPGAARPDELLVVRKGANRYWVYVFGSPIEVVIDERGRVVSSDGRLTTQKFIAERRGSLDLGALATLFAERERASRPAGVLSTRDTVNAVVGSAQLWVDYGRPTARGRRVFASDGVLGDTVWRTGANAATQFRTNVPLMIEGKTIPPGTYTLWTLAIPGRYQLIVNKQTGQWGTVYDPKQDLVRLPMRVSRLPSVVDRFTVTVDPTSGNAGVLRLQWDTTELSVPFTVP